MPIKSFLAHPKNGQKQQLVNDLEAIPSCEIIPSTNQELVVIVTDTASKEEDIKLEERINALPSLAMLSMVSGFDNKDIKPKENV